MANQVTTRFGSKGAKQVTGEIKGLRDAFDRLQKQGAKGFGVGVGASVTTAALNMVGGAISSVTDYLQDSAEAYRDDIKSQAALRTSLAANDSAYRGNASAIEKVLEKRIELGFSDDEQRSSLAFLVAVTKDHTKALDLQRTAMDLARLRGIDLATASDILAKVYGGNIGILSRYGIQLKKGTTATEALAQVQKMASGQAEAYAETIGKTEVAQIKAAEASEKFGKQVDRIQGFFMPLATGAIEGFANEVDALALLMDKTAPPLDQLDAGVRALETSFLNSVPGIHDLILELRKEADKALDAAAAEETHGDALIGVRQAAPPAADAIDEVADASEKAKAETKRVVDMLDRLNDAADKLPEKLDAVTDALFGGAQRTGDLADAQQDLAELLDDEPKRLGENGKVTRAWKIWAGEVAAAKQRIFELQFQMKQKEGPEAVDAWLRDQRTSFGKTNQKALDLLNTLIAFNSLKIHTIRVPVSLSGISTSALSILNKKVPEFASGGIVKAQPGGTIVKVGEGGKDEAIVPLTNGGMPVSGGGGTTELHFHFPNAYGMTPGQAQMVAAAVEPIITRTLQKRGQLAGARAF